jgi:hypothetical protein
MAVKGELSAAEIREAWEGGAMSTLEAIARTLAIVHPGNIDHVLGALPGPVRVRLLEIARDYPEAGEPAVDVSMRRDIAEHPDARSALRDWFARHDVARAS